MGLSSALATAMSGLRANQAALSIMSSNVANAQTPGYVTQNRQSGRSGQRRRRYQRSGHRRHPRARPLRPEPVAHRDLRRRICRPDGEYSRPIAERLRHARRRRHAGNRVHQFYHRIAGAFDESGSQSAQTAAVAAAQIAGAAAEFDDAGHSDAAHQCRAGHRHVGYSGQRGDVPDRDDQHPASGLELDRSGRRDADGPARHRDQHALATDGCSRHHRRSNQTSVFTNSGVQLVGGGQASQLLHLGGRAERQVALQHQPDQIRCRIAHDQASERRERSISSRTTRSVRARSPPI